MSAIKDMLIEVEDATNLFEKNFRAMGFSVRGSTMLTQADKEEFRSNEAGVRANAYDAFYDLYDVVTRLIGTSAHGPEHYAPKDLGGTK